jgi:hypothetical protein
MIFSFHRISNDEPVPLIVGARKLYLMDVFHNYRWLVILVESLMASVVKLAVDLSSHHHPR